MDGRTREVFAPTSNLRAHLHPALRPLLERLGLLNLGDNCARKPLRLSVEGTCQLNPDSRGLAGSIFGGTIRRGDEAAILPAGQITRIKSIFGPNGAVEIATVGDAVTVILEEEIAASRGDMLVAAQARPPVADQFAAHLVWLSSKHLQPGRSYLIDINNNVLPATVTKLKHRLEIGTLTKLAAKDLAQNDVGVCNLALARSVPFDPYVESSSTGAFTLIDRYSNEIVAAGIVDFALRRASNIHLQKLAVSKTERAALMRHKPAVLWFTGLSGAGKSTIANLVEAGLHARDVHTILLDGDNVRHGLNRDLGFTETDRVENIRRISEVAKLMTDAGLIVLCSFISPFRAERRMARELVGEGEFLEVYVDTPLNECIARDPKGLYKRALAGEIKNFTGVDQPYEVPEDPELHLKAGGGEPGKLAESIIADLGRRGII